MLPPVTVPASLAGLLQTFRSCFTAPSFGMFTVLVVGLVAQTGRRSVCGMLAGAGVQALVAHDRAHRFFAAARWSTDHLGLLLARLIADRLVPAGVPIPVVVDDTLFARRGKKVYAALWTHDGSAPGANKTGRGNRWIIVGLVVELGFLSRPVCLPVLFRLWHGKGCASHVELARQLVGLLACAFAGRDLHVAADAAYHGRPLRDLPKRVTWTTRIQHNAVLYQPAPPRTGRRGRPRSKGERIGTPAEVAATATWRKVTVIRYGRVEVVLVAETVCLWYGAFGPRTGRLVLVREPDSTKPYDLALYTTDTDTTVELIVARYAGRWSVEVAIATAKGPMGIGQARNRVTNAVERTVPFGMLAMSLVIVWYTQHGHHRQDVATRRLLSPWYASKTEPSFEDMLAGLRRTIIAARFLPRCPAQPTDQEINAVRLAWEAAAA
jgi:DDE superfamily endonuclease